MELYAATEVVSDAGKAPVKALLAYLKFPLFATNETSCVREPSGAASCASMPLTMPCMYELNHYTLLQRRITS